MPAADAAGLMFIFWGMASAVWYGGWVGPAVMVAGFALIGWGVWLRGW